MKTDRRGTFVISIDVEMSWGAIHHGMPHDLTPYQRERESVSNLLEKMDRYDISSTWAVVGHLFLEHCSFPTGAKHPNIVRPEYPWYSGDWYQLDPCSSLPNSPTWYAPDLVEAIRSSKTQQEIGSHSFGHLIVGEEGCSADAFRTDLEHALLVAQDVGISLDSFVFPRNSIGHLQVLRESGFSSYRSNTPARFSEHGRSARSVLAAIDKVKPLNSGAIHPSVEDGLVAIPQTYLFNPSSSTANRLGTELWARTVRRRLRHAVRTSSLFHLWFHSHNISDNPPRAMRALEVLFSDAADLIGRGELSNLTMNQYAKKLARTEAPHG